MYFLCTRYFKTVEHLSFILRISIPHDIISTWLDHGCDWSNYVTMATNSVTWLARATFQKAVEDLSFILRWSIRQSTQKVGDLVVVQLTWGYLNISMLQVFARNKIHQDCPLLGHCIWTYTCIQVGPAWFIRITAWTRHHKECMDCCLECILKDVNEFGFEYLQLMQPGKRGKVYPKRA